MTEPTGLDRLLEVPSARRAALGPLLERLRAARHVVLSTHVNADGDGAGSQAAVAAWLETLGARVDIVNPTPFPAQLRFVLPRAGLAHDAGSPAAEAAIAAADLFLVLDTSEPQRLGGLAGRFPRDRTVVLDHHPAGPQVVGDLAVQDAGAAATGELVHDLLRLDGAEWPYAAALGVYVAIVSDTGSFRYANASPRVHAIAAQVMQHGVDPETVYGHLFGMVPRRRLELLRDALGTLQTADDGRVAYMVVDAATIERLGASHEDLEGLIEHARALESTEVAILFRETADRRTKISFRARGDADVNRIARRFGGGGHTKASGAVVDGVPAEVVPRVLAAVREEMGRG